MLNDTFKKWSANVPSPQTIAFFSRIGLTPFALTYLSIAGKAAAFLLLFMGHTQWAGIPLFLEAVFDGLDGRMARALGTTSKLGAFTDMVSDRIFRSGYYLAMAHAGTIGWEWAAAAIFLDLAMGIVSDAVREKKLRALPIGFDSFRELPFSAPLGLVPLGLIVKFICGGTLLLTNLLAVGIMNRRNKDVRPSA